MQISPVLHFMINAALKAVYIALKRKQEGLKVAVKPDGSRITNGDSQSEQIIRDALEKSFPVLRQQLGLSINESVGFVMEETASDYDRRKSGYNFIVDPIDGTRGYSGQNPGAPWAISIALEKDGRTLAAAVYEAGENEFCVDAAGKDMPFDAAHPQGKIFIAEASVAGAYCIRSPAAGFDVHVLNKDANFEQIQKNALWILKDIPTLKTDFSKGSVTLLDRNTPLAIGAGLELDYFKPDWDIKPFENGQVSKAIQQACEKFAPIHTCFSSVSGGLKAADGRAAGFAHGNGYPWDHSAIRLILQNSGTPFVQYEVPGAEEERSLLIAGRNIELFTALHNSVLSQKELAGKIIASANLPSGQ